MLQKRFSTNSILLKLIAVTLLFISGFYVLYSVRAGTAVAIYHKVKSDVSSTLSNSAEDFQSNDIFVQCRKAQQLYPYNYRLLAWSAEEAFELSQNSIGADRVEYLNLAEVLCDRGLSLNRYMMPMPFIKMQLICLRSIKEGTEYWEEYTEWDYWNSYNHAVLAGLYAADGKFGKAMQSLQFIKGTEDFAEADRIVNDYFNADSVMPIDFRSFQ